MRSGSDSTFMQVVLALVVVSFIGWGSGGNQGSDDSVAKVNGAPISPFEYSNAVRSAERAAEAQGRTLTDADRETLKSDVLQQLIEREAMLQEAHRLGVEVSDAEVASRILELPQLLDKDGKFDRKAYENLLRAVGLTQDAFEARQRDELVLQKLQEVLSVGVGVSDGAVEAAWVEENTKVEMDVVRVRPSAFYARVDTSDAAIDAWIAGHEGDIKARYERDLAARYDQPEKVELRLIQLDAKDESVSVADLRSQLESARAEIEAGADFAEKAQALTTGPAKDLGGKLPATEPSKLESTVQAAIANLQPGQMTSVLVGQRDVRLFQLVGRTARKVVTLDEARRDIAKSLMQESQGPKLALAFAETTLRDAWAATGTVPQAELDAVGLKVTPTGALSMAEAASSPVAPPARLMELARTAASGTVLPEVVEDQGQYVVARLSTRTDADRAAFAAQASLYREIALARARKSFVEAWVADVVARASVERRATP
jgi:peptidyl-prolyl cis-trans isomerase D